MYPRYGIGPSEFVTYVCDGLSGRVRQDLGTGRADVDANLTRNRALAAYKAFPTLWKHADREIPIHKEAKSEYAKLH